MSTLPYRAVLAAAILLCPTPDMISAGGFDAALSRQLAAEFRETISGTAIGAEVYSRLDKINRIKPPKVLLRYDDMKWLAAFNEEKNSIRFNMRFVLRFFGGRKYKQALVAEVLHKDPGLRAEFVRRADVIYLHELVHALQRSLYPHYRPGMPHEDPVELEYEAYLTEDLYCHEKMKKDPALLKAFIGGTYYDLYTAAALETYFMLSLDMNAYKDRIRRKYADGPIGYSTFDETVAAQENTAAGAKIAAYASGKTKDYSGQEEALSIMRAEKKAYAAFLENFYAVYWPKFSAEALALIGGSALDVRNYPMALEFLAVADENAARHGAPPEEFKKLKEKGAVAILETAAFIKDNRKKMTLEELSRDYRALETACSKTGRQFPPELASMRSGLYDKARAYYSGLAASEKRPEKKEFYEENVKYFSMPEEKAGPGRAP